MPLNRCTGGRGLDEPRMGGVEQERDHQRTAGGAITHEHQRGTVSWQPTPRCSRPPAENIGMPGLWRWFDLQLSSGSPGPSPWLSWLRSM